MKKTLFTFVVGLVLGLCLTLARADAPVLNLYSIYTDQLNTPRMVTDAQRSVVWQALPDEPFGLDVPDEDPNHTGTPFVFNLRFPGQYYDPESGLNYNLNRDYDPATGRYVESDPLGLQAGINTYAYVGGNPPKYTDPKGLWAEEAVAAALVFCRLNPAMCAGGAYMLCRALGGCETTNLICNQSSQSNPLTGEPGCEQSCENKKGNKKQTRRFGQDGYPETDTDWDHSHDGLGAPHAHDWGRPGNGGPPTANDRGPGRPVKPGDPGVENSE